MNLFDIFEGAIDDLEARRIEDLNAKMDDLTARAKSTTDPRVKEALRHDFAKAKAERDSYYKINVDEAPGAETLAHNQSTDTSNLQALGLAEAGKTMDPDEVGYMLNKATIQKIVNNVFAQKLPDVKPIVKTLDKDNGTYSITSSDDMFNLELSVIGQLGDIGVFVENAYNSHKGAGVVTDIIRGCYAAAEQQWGTPQTRTLQPNQDTGHGVWQAMADKLGVTYEAGARTVDTGAAAPTGNSKYGVGAEVEGTPPKAGNTKTAIIINSAGLEWAPMDITAEKGDTYLTGMSTPITLRWVDGTEKPATVTKEAVEQYNAQIEAKKAYNFIRDNWMDDIELRKYAGTTKSPQAFYQAVHDYRKKAREDNIVASLARAFDSAYTGSNDSPWHEKESSLEEHGGGGGGPAQWHSYVRAHRTNEAGDRVTSDRPLTAPETPDSRAQASRSKKQQMLKQFAQLGTIRTEFIWASEHDVFMTKDQILDYLDQTAEDPQLTALEYMHNNGYTTDGLLKGMLTSMAKIGLSKADIFGIFKSAKRGNNNAAPGTISRAAKGLLRSEMLEYKVVDEHGGGVNGMKNYISWRKKANTEHGVTKAPPPVGKSAPSKLPTIPKGTVHGKLDQSRGVVPKASFEEGWQDFNKVEPYAVCLAGKPIKKFDYYEEARRFHDNWKQKLYREGDKAKADKITLMPLNLDEAANPAQQAAIAINMKKHHQTPKQVDEDYGSWIVYDPATKEIKKRFKTHTAGKSYAKTHNLGFASSEYYFDNVKQSAVAEGAKVDRMQKHIAKSEKDLGHSKKDAESIAWATLNKRGYLDNKNKKTNESLEKVPTEKLKALWNQHKDEQRPSPAFAQQLRLVAKELARRKEVDEASMDWASHKSTGPKFSGYLKGTDPAPTEYGNKSFGAESEEMEEGIAGNMTVKSAPITQPLRQRNFVAKNAIQSGAGKHANQLKKAQAAGRHAKHKGQPLDLEEGDNFLSWAVRNGYNLTKPAVYESARNTYKALVEDCGPIAPHQTYYGAMDEDLKQGEFYVWTVYFDDGTSKRIKVTSDEFDPYKYYAKEKKNVVNVDYNWIKHQ